MKEQVNQMTMRNGKLDRIDEKRRVERPGYLNGVHRAIVFDLDDTLVAWTDRSRASLRFVAAMLADQHPGGPSAAVWWEHLLRLDPLDVWEQAIRGEVEQEEYHRARFRRTLEHFRLPAGARQVEPLYQAYRQQMIVRARLDLGVRPLLRALSGRYQLGLITNGCAAFQIPTLRRLQLDAFFRPLLIADELRIYKPDPAIFQRALEQLGVRPEQAVMVGDNYAHDIEGAAQVGMQTIWVNPTGAPEPGRAADWVVWHVLQIEHLVAAPLWESSWTVRERADSARR